MNEALRRTQLRVNGAEHNAEVPVRALLSDYLRHSLGLTGTRVGCEQGVCGACTVLVDGIAMRSCLMLAVQADGSHIETVESLSADDGPLTPFAQAMQDEHGLQCGFCTPGILMSVTAAARQGQDLETTLEQTLGGHVCRCTGYIGIRAAVSACWRAEATS